MLWDPIDDSSLPNRFSYNLLHATNNLPSLFSSRHHHVTMEARNERFESSEEKEKQQMSCDDDDDDKKPRGMVKETKLLHVQLHHHMCLHF